MKVDDRETYAKTNRLCYVCCQPMHGNSPCWNDPNYKKKCPECAQFNETVFHNSTLCRRTEAKRIQKAKSAYAAQNPSGSKSSEGRPKQNA